ncbi:MAG TPA: alternative ribosome rescue aminoacyl-tRNA hydrolase ArfB [Pirellulaceae bacterium]|nr:alternative ribosome rescue aminoacyl-tRNA hydrolase ArfB [Pirellulaceae bacterium]
MLAIDSRTSIPLEEFTITFVRSGGPGGQNVNKVATKAVLRWDVVRSPSLRDDVRARFLEKFASKLTQDGELILTGQKFRTQERNREDCLEKLRDMVREVLVAPRRRKPTRPTKGSVRRRLDDKKQTSERKAQRRRPES